MFRIVGEPAGFEVNDPAELLTGGFDRHSNRLSLLMLHRRIHQSE